MDVRLSSKSNSLARFQEGKAIVEEWEKSKGGDIIDFTFSALNRLSNAHKTVWKVIYDIKAGAIWLIIADREGRSFVNLSALNFSASSMPSCFDLSRTTPGNISMNFLPMTEGFVNQFLGEFFNDPRFVNTFGDFRNFMPSIIDSYRNTYGTVHDN